MPSKKHRKAAKAIGKRKTRTRETRKVFLIVCEGQETEPNYFKALANDLRVNAQVKITGIGNDPRTLLHKAKEYMRRDGHDETWCVFDKDQVDDYVFNSVVQQIEQSSAMNAAWSNSCFELWFVLHYNYHVTPSRPVDYEEILSAKMGGYDKTHSNHYDLLLENALIAEKNAKKLLKEYDGKPPAQCNPATTVFKLVERLREYSNEIYSH